MNEKAVTAGELTTTRVLGKCPWRRRVSVRELQLAANVLDALVEGRFWRKKEYQPFNEVLCVCDLVIRVNVKPDGSNEYYFEERYNVEGEGEDPEQVKRGESLIVCNETPSRLRLSFFEDKFCSEYEKAGAQLDLSKEEGIPVLVIERCSCAAIKTYGAEEKQDPLSLWINLEEHDAANDEWIGGVKGGGNGPEMELVGP